VGEKKGVEVVIKKKISEKKALCHPLGRNQAENQQKGHRAGRDLDSEPKKASKKKKKHAFRRGLEKKKDTNTLGFQRRERTGGGGGEKKKKKKKKTLRGKIEKKCIWTFKGALKKRKSRTGCKKKKHFTKKGKKKNSKKKKYLVQLKKKEPFSKKGGIIRITRPTKSHRKRIHLLRCGKEGNPYAEKKKKEPVNIPNN